MATRSCVACKKAMMMMDAQVAGEGGFYHKECFKCCVCKGQLTLSSLSTMNGALYCKPHCALSRANPGAAAAPRRSPPARAPRARLELAR